MDKLFLIATLLVCVLVHNVLSERSVEFPAEACVTALTGNYVGCIGALANSIWKLSQWGEDTPVTVCGNQCTGSVKGRLSKWKWKWDARFQCQNKGQGILGTSTAYSQNGAMEHAIQDWITKAAQAGKIQTQDFRC
jgi:hypothetical protein